MAFRWTVEADITRIPLTDDGSHWIEVKHRLTWGERKRLEHAGFGDMGANDQIIGIDWVAFDTQKILTWVTDWSARDSNDKVLPLDTDGVAALHPDVGDLILRKLDEHVESLGNEEDAAVTDAPTNLTPPRN